jgi:membrane-associated phospholipid phosphatase
VGLTGFPVRIAESIAAGYLSYLLLLGTAGTLAPGRRRHLLTGAATALAALLAVALLLAEHLPVLVRDLLPGPYVLIGYWLTGLLYTQPLRRVEDQLLLIDRRLFDDLNLTAFLASAPRLLLEYLELAYLCCYLVVPAGFAVLYLSGHQAETDRFWTIVLLATFVAYGVLPWLPTRPPRALEGAAAIDRRNLALRRANLFVLDRGSIQVNTLPSGHAAGAFATALALGDTLPAIASLFAVVAVSIAAASVLGRYHYAVDSVTGMLVAVGAWLVVR